MRLIKVRDNHNRPVSGLDLMLSAVFGKQIPREFISGEKYKTGEHVYYVDNNGELRIWKCRLGGTYLNCGDPGFIEWSLDSAINNNFSKFLSTKIIDPEMYETKSVISTTESYREYDGTVYFNAVFDNFNLNDYTGPNDIIDVYLRREHSDSYLAPFDYTFDGNGISLELPLSDIADVSNCESKYLPEGITIESTTDVPFWYEENDVIKTFNPSTNGINLTNYDILSIFNKSIEYGYKIASLKVESVHTLVESNINGVPVYRLDEININGNHGSIGEDTCIPNIQTLTIPVEVEAARNITDELRISFNPSTQLIDVSSKNGYIKQVSFSIVARKLKPISAFIIGSKAKGDMTKFVNVINEYGRVVIINDEKLIEVPCYDLLKYNSFDYELYINRIFRSDYEEFIDDTGRVYIKPDNPDNIDWDKDKFLFHIFYSLTQSTVIERTTDTLKVKDDKDKFRMFLTTEFINKYQWMKVREDSKLIPPEYVVGAKGIVAINDESHYLNENRVMRADVFSLVFRDHVSRLLDSTDTYNSEAYPIMERTRKLTIPFIDYDIENDDFLIFRSGGVLVSSAKWYLNGDHVNVYSHENPLEKGDYIDFRLLDRDNTVRIYNSLITATSDNQQSISVEHDLSNVAFLLLFTVSGQYISPCKYTVNGNTITFNSDVRQPFTVYKNMRFEVVYGVFKKDYSKTIYTTLQLDASDENQMEFTIADNIDYNPASDNILVFREDGMYVGERFYHIDEETNKIVIDNGTGVPVGSHIDIIIIRNLIVEISTVKEGNDND